ncbi:MAG: hypothetical protein HQL01_02560 [Nitrospirae bacterium]|nr:hypothetical protein [Nitrospirota bacterium]
MPIDSVNSNTVPQQITPSGVQDTGKATGTSKAQGTGDASSVQTPKGADTKTQLDHNLTQPNASSQDLQNASNTVVDQNSVLLEMMIMIDAVASQLSSSQNMDAQMDEKAAQTAAQSQASDIKEQGEDQMVAAIVGAVVSLAVSAVAIGMTVKSANMDSLSEEAGSNLEDAKFELNSSKETLSETVKDSKTEISEAEENLGKARENYKTELKNAGGEEDDADVYSAKSKMEEAQKNLTEKQAGVKDAADDVSAKKDAVDDARAKFKASAKTAKIWNTLNQVTAMMPSTFSQLASAAFQPAISSLNADAAIEQGQQQTQQTAVSNDQQQANSTAQLQSEIISKISDMLQMHEQARASLLQS